MTDQIDALRHLYLQDSCVLGLDESPTDLRFSMLFALTKQHPNFSLPLNGEQYGYRYGHLALEGVHAITWSRKTFKPTADLDGEIDYGVIDRVGVDGDTCRLEGPWGDVSVRAAHLSVSLNN